MLIYREIQYKAVDEIYLSENEIESIHLESFQNLTRLGALMLSKNRIREIRKQDSYLNIPNISIIYLLDNWRYERLWNRGLSKQLDPLSDLSLFESIYDFCYIHAIQHLFYRRKVVDIVFYQSVLIEDGSKNRFNCSILLFFFVKFNIFIFNLKSDDDSERFFEICYKEEIKEIELFSC